jgi:hypothetical protein
LRGLPSILTLYGRSIALGYDDLVICTFKILCYRETVKERGAEVVVEL